LVESILVIENGKRLTGNDIRKYLKGIQSNGEERNLPMFIPKPSESAERELIYRALVDLKGDILELKSIVAGIMNPVSSSHRDQYGAVQTERRGTPVAQTPAAGLENLSIEEMERKMIIDSLQKYGGNRRSAAQALKISERTLYRKIKEYGLQ
jgi:DNA-binding NtrC family response regulator